MCNGYSRCCFLREKATFSSKTQIPIYTLSPNGIADGIFSSLREKAGTTRPENCSCLQQRKSSIADRFIPQRRHRNFDAMNYNLTRVPPRSDIPVELDVFSQVATLETTWRKRLAKQAMEKANVIPGLKDRRIFNFTESENRKPIVDENRHEASWKSKARIKPLFKHDYFKIKLPRSRMTHLETLDWGAQNFIAATIETRNENLIILFDATIDNSEIMSKPGKVLARLKSVRAIKWNHTGDRIAAINDKSELSVYSLEKLCWNRDCPCNTKKQETQCVCVCLTWTHSDREILVCCEESRITSYTSTGELTHSILMKPRTFCTSMAFSPNDRYFAVSTLYAIDVYDWPSFTLYLQIESTRDFDFKMPIAWNPWEMNVLCIGACPKASSICLWDVHRPKFLGLKPVSEKLAIQEIAWNKLSCEMVIRWDYTKDLQRCSMVAVLASLDRIVDFVSKQKFMTRLTWNPDNTKLAMRDVNGIDIHEFFGSETKAWYNSDEEEMHEKRRKRMASLKRRREIYTDHTRHFEYYNIR